ncbi:MAG: hypothetical protein LAT84_05400 [Balneolia bacterium]|nr:hypothetical protein [Balneolia bacterium]
MYLLILLAIITSLQWPDRIELQPEEESLNIRSIVSCGEQFFTVDRYMKSINSFDNDGTFIKSYASPGEGPGDFDEQRGPRSISCLKSGNLMVIDATNRALEFDTEFNHIQTHVIQRTPGMINPIIQSLLFETETHYYFSVAVGYAGDHSSVLVVNRDTFVEENLLGAPMYSSHRILSRHSTYFDTSSNYFVSVNFFIGLIIPYQYQSEEYSLFKIQDQQSIEFVEKNLPEIARPPADYEAVGWLDGPVISTIAPFNGELYLIQDRYASEPLSYIDIYDYEGNRTGQIENTHQIESLTVLNGALYGYNQDDFKFFLIATP